jgi:hypothetical protein
MMVQAAIRAHATSAAAWPACFVGLEQLVPSPWQRERADEDQDEKQDPTSERVVRLDMCVRRGRRPVVRLDGDVAFAAAVRARDGPLRHLLGRFAGPNGCQVGQLVVHVVHGCARHVIQRVRRSGNRSRLRAKIAMTLAAATGTSPAPTRLADSGGIGGPVHFAAEDRRPERHVHCGALGGGLSDGDQVFSLLAHQDELTTQLFPPPSDGKVRGTSRP